MWKALYKCSPLLFKERKKEREGKKQKKIERKKERKKERKEKEDGKRVREKGLRNNLI